MPLLTFGQGVKSRGSSSGRPSLKGSFKSKVNSVMECLPSTSTAPTHAPPTDEISPTKPTAPPNKKSSRFGLTTAFSTIPSLETLLFDTLPKKSSTQSTTRSEHGLGANEASVRRSLASVRKPSSDAGTTVSHAMVMSRRRHHAVRWIAT